MLLKFFKYLFFLILTLVLYCNSQAQNKTFIIEGFIYNVESSQPLPGANVFVEKMAGGTASDLKGYYSLKLSQGNYRITFSYTGFESKTIEVELNKPEKIDISLSLALNEIGEVVISSNKLDKNLTSTETGQITIKKKDLENLPFLFGEVDPVRIIQLMPGIQTSGEGNTGFYVRGGAVDQNLILLDQAVVYNPSHLFGFFSVFNGNVVDGIDLYKSGIPSYYGGRLSSITKVSTRMGSYEKYKAEAGIGLIAANVMIEGPMKKDKGSILFSARRTYVDLLAETLKNLSILTQDINYYFYDMNLNASYKITPDDQISFKSYAGNDDFKYNKENNFSNSIKWGNRTASWGWKHFFNDEFSSDLALIATQYDMNFGAGINTFHFKIASDIRDLGFNYQLELKKRQHKVTAGLNYIRHSISPNNVKAYSEDVQLNISEKVKLHADEAAIFINDQFSLSEKIEINAGFRFSGYSQIGPFTRYNTNESFQVLDTVLYRSNKRIKSYANPEPRVAVRYSLNEFSSFKLSYDKSFQYMHMAPLSSVSLPLDIWVPSSHVIKPQAADQFSGGYFRNFLDNSIEGSVVLYFKEMKNQLEYRDGVIIGYSKGFNFDDNFVFGKGRSYGAEFLLKKNKGKINGLIAYTLSRTMREFKELNYGKPFPAKYDRLHDFSTMINYDYNSRWTISGIFVYGTGNALNLPIGRYMINGNLVNEYGGRNSFRMPSYHRMDLAVTFTARKTQKFESYWNFSIYNVYNRKNPYYIYFESKGDLKEYKLETQLKQVSLFPIIPSISYRCKFH